VIVDRIIRVARGDPAVGHVDQRLGDRAGLLRGGVAPPEEEALDPLVLGLVQQDAVGGDAVAPGTPGFLVVALERAGEVVVG